MYGRLFFHIINNHFIQQKDSSIASSAYAYVDIYFRLNSSTEHKSKIPRGTMDDPGKLASFRLFVDLPIFNPLRNNNTHKENQ